MACGQIGMLRGNRQGGRYCAEFQGRVLCPHLCSRLCIQLNLSCCPVARPRALLGVLTLWARRGTRLPVWEATNLDMEGGATKLTSTSHAFFTLSLSSLCDLRSSQRGLLAGSPLIALPIQLKA